jgi:hypothetical protein
MAVVVPRQPGFVHLGECVTDTVPASAERVAEEHAQAVPTGGFARTPVLPPRASGPAAAGRQREDGDAVALDERGHRFGIQRG